MVDDVFVIRSVARRGNDSRGSGTRAKQRKMVEPLVVVVVLRGSFAALPEEACRAHSFLYYWRRRRRRDFPFPQELMMRHVSKTQSDDDDDDDDECARPENVYFFTSRPKKPDDDDDDDDDAKEVLRDSAKKSRAFCERELFHSKERKSSLCDDLVFPVLCVSRVRGEFF